MASRRDTIVDGLTGRQVDILAFICDHRARHGFPPSMREIGDEVGLVSTSSVAYQLGVLRRAGRLRWHPKVPRSYVVVESGAASGQVNGRLRQRAT